MRAGGDGGEDNRTTVQGGSTSSPAEILGRVSAASKQHAATSAVNVANTACLAVLPAPVAAHGLSCGQRYNGSRTGDELADTTT